MSGEQNNITPEQTQKILEQTITILSQEKGNQARCIDDLKSMLDLKLTDSQREVNNKNFLLDLKMFRTKSEFTKFMQQIRAKIDIQIKDYYTLQSLYELQKGEIQTISKKIDETERVANVLRDNNIYVDISLFVARAKDIETESNTLKTDNITLREDIRDHKQLTEQLKDINSREKQLFNLQIEGLKEEVAQEKQDKMNILKDILRLQQSTSLDMSDTVMRDLLQNNEKDIKQIISDQQEDAIRAEEDKRQEELAALKKLQDEERCRKDQALAAKRNKQSKHVHPSTKMHRLSQGLLNKSLNKSIDLAGSSTCKYQNIEGFSETAKLISKKNSHSNLNMMKQTKYLNKSMNKSMSKRSVHSRSPSKDNSICKDRSIIILHKEINSGLTQSPCKKQNSTIIKDLLQENNLHQPMPGNEFLSYSQIVPQNILPCPSAEKTHNNSQIVDKEIKNITPIAQSTTKTFKGLSSFKYDYSKKKQEAKKNKY